MSDPSKPGESSTLRSASAQQDHPQTPDTEATLSFSPTQQGSIPSENEAAAQVTVRECAGNRLDSSGLHIRCPHCHNQVEFLEEHEQNDIICSTCGSIFNIVSPEVGTCHATPLNTVGNFELITRVGIGSFGAVWKAYDPELDRSVAVKIPRRGQLDPLDESQFLREARVTAQLRHPNIVSVHEIGREGDTLYIVSDLVRGVTLAEVLKVRQLTVHEVLEISIKIADALQHAHKLGVVHRDLKPSNIMIDRQGEPFLTDFGLAKRDVGEITMTADGQILGTPAYMSPEQAAGDAHHVDRRTDIYALGVVLFELLTNELPFRGSAQMQIHQKLSEEPPDPRTLNRLIPRDLATICLKCIQREPNRRFRTAADLLSDLNLFVHGEPIRARPISRMERMIRWTKRHPAPATIGVLVTFLAIAGPIVALRFDRLRQRAEDLLAQKIVLINNRDEKILTANEKIKALDSQAQRLQTELGSWESGTDPSAIWPPYKTRRPRVQLLEKMVSDLTYTEQMLQDATNDEQRALVHLALGTVYETLDDRHHALTHFQAARKLLQELTTADVDLPGYLPALADCLLRIAGLKLPEEHAQAVELLRQAQAIQQRLAAQQESLPLQAALFDTELRLTLEAGRESAPESLRRAEQIFRQEFNRNPRNPRELYELACFLSERPPLMINPLPTSD